MINVMEALTLNHPQSHPPHSSTLLSAQILPLFEDIDITVAHIDFVADRIQGSAGPGGCDSSRWQDVLLRFGPHSQCLRDVVANLVCQLTNSLFDWFSIRAVLDSRLIALTSVLALGKKAWERLCAALFVRLSVL